MQKLKIVKETMEVVGLKSRFDLPSLYKQAESDKDLENLLVLWYNVHSDSGLSEMVLKQIELKLEN